MKQYITKQRVFRRNAWGGMESGSWPNELRLCGWSMENLWEFPKECRRVVITATTKKPAHDDYLLLRKKDGLWIYKDGLQHNVREWLKKNFPNEKQVYIICEF